MKGRLLICSYSYVDHPELEALLPIPFILIYLENDINGFFKLQQGQFVSHIKTNTGDDCVTLPHREAEMLFFYDPGIAGVHNLAGYKYGAEVFRTKRFHLAKDIVKRPFDIAELDFCIDYGFRYQQIGVDGR